MKRGVDFCAAVALGHSFADSESVKEDAAKANASGVAVPQMSGRGKQYDRFVQHRCVCFKNGQRCGRDRCLAMAPLRCRGGLFERDGQSGRLRCPQPGCGKGRYTLSECAAGQGDSSAMFTATSKGEKKTRGPSAMINFGVCCKNGRGIAKDEIATAVDPFHRAADQGHQGAIDAVAAKRRMRD